MKFRPWLYWKGLCGKVSHPASRIALTLAGASLFGSALYLPAWGGNGATRIEIAINGMVCSFCAQGIENRLKTVPGASAIQVDLQHRLVKLQINSGGTVSDDRLRTLIRDAGFDVRRIERTSLQP
jgi:mercuric ion binding protein